MNAVAPTLSMLFVLTLSSMSLLCVSVLAPLIAPALGASEALVGAFFSTVYLCAMLSGATTGLLTRRFGPVRVCQWTMALAALGLSAVASGSLALATLGAVMLGIAYGPFNPASAEVLASVGTPRLRPVIFSVKQLGVPLGGGLAGALLPTLATALGWQGAVGCIALACVGVLMLLVPLRRRIDRPGAPERLRLREMVLRPVLAACRDVRLRLYTATAFLLAGVQVSLGAYLVVLLVRDHGLSLGVAGVVFAALQAGATVGRVGWGAVASRWLDARKTLLLIALLDAALIALLDVAGAGASVSVLAAMAAALGACSFGWNGVLLAQVASSAPPGRIGEATGGMQFFMFGGVVLWPPLFGAAAAASGSFAPALWMLCGVSVLAAAVVSRAE